MLKLLLIPVLCFMLTACDQKSGGQTAPQSVGLDTPAAGSAPQPVPASAINAAQPTTEQSGQAPMPQAQAVKTYTFQGNVLLPPNVYMEQAKLPVDQTNICGVLSLTDASAQKYCFKFSELYNRLYDADHSGLDVWDVQTNAQGTWYLLLTKSDTADQQKELWVAKNQFGVYHPYADIMQQKLLFLGDWDYKTQPEWPLQAYDGPGGAVIEIKKEAYPEKKSQSPMIMITSVAQSAKQELWFRINLINSLCEQSKDAPVAPVIMNLWYPAYRLENNLHVPTVWYSAKGC